MGQEPTAENPNPCREWCYWSSQGSTQLLIWESKDLITWGNFHAIDVDPDGVIENPGMAWAPEATWVPDYNGEGNGAFVVYWSANTGTWPNYYSKVLWGATTDFEQATYEYGGVFVDTGANVIDTTMIQNDGKTYRITKDNGTDKGLYMESTASATWWKSDTRWTQLQTKIGAEWTNGCQQCVEGPAVFKSHDSEQFARRYGLVFNRRRHCPRTAA